MSLSSSSFFITAAVLLPLGVVLSAIWKGGALALGVLIAGGLLIVNLYFWTKIVQHLVSMAAQGFVSGRLTFFFILKGLVLASAMILPMKFFSPLTVLISNTLIVASILIPSLGSVLHYNIGVCK
jgi:hypothetical protein